MAKRAWTINTPDAAAAAADVTKGMLPPCSIGMPTQTDRCQVTTKNNNCYAIKLHKYIGIVLTTYEFDIFFLLWEIESITRQNFIALFGAQYLYSAFTNA